MSLQRRLASQSTIIFGARLGGAGLIFLAQAFIARFWGADLLGQYLVIIASVNLISVVMPLGFQTIGTYFASEYRARGERRQLTTFLARSYGHVVATTGVLLVLGLPLLNLIGQGDSVLAHHFVPAILLAFSTAVIYVNGSMLIGVKRPFAGFFADSIFRPMLIMAAFLIGMTFTSPADGFSSMMWVIAIGYLGVAFAHFCFVVDSVRKMDDTAPPSVGETRRWWRFALPWVLISLATDFFFDIDLLLLTHSLSTEELAIFGVCTRIFALVSFGVSAVYAITLPDMFESEAKADRQAFNRKIGDANLVASGVSLLLFACMAIGAPFALMLFGPSFSVGAAPLAVLCLGLVIRSVMGPASVVLSIHDRPYASLPSVAVGMVTLVVCNWLLVPSFGLMGAAIAANISIAVWSVGQWYVALRTAKLDVSLAQWFRNRSMPVPAE